MVNPAYGKGRKHYHPGKDKNLYKELKKLVEEAENNVKVLDSKGKAENSKLKGKSGVVVYWMRNKDLRLNDNHALSLASSLAHSRNPPLPLVVIHILSPEDFKAHDTSNRRIDFMLRNLSILKGKLDELKIPIHVPIFTSRKTIPSQLLTLLTSWDTKYLFANIEHEVDELKRDIETINLAQKRDVQARFVDDISIIHPGLLFTGQNKPYSVFSPWAKKWEDLVSKKDLSNYEFPTANSDTVKQHPTLSKIFEENVPHAVPGFELEDEEAKSMLDLWPAGEDVAETILENFLKSKPMPSDKSQKSSDKSAGISRYKNDRDRCDIDGTSCLSPYLASGVISARACVRATAAVPVDDNQKGEGKIVANRDSGKGMWCQEIAWRDFYQGVLVEWPRVCMGHSYQLKYDDVAWDYDGDRLKSWKEGRTGFPIVDAGMRQLRAQGWCHNRLRMVVAMFLCKDLMIDWREGEKFFMENLIDGDFGSNNGGWQWSSSTGTDPMPYFRIMNPLSQSAKADVTGDFIRRWVPELQKLKGKVLYDPFHNMPKAEFKNLNYPEPIVDHSEARQRALARYKTPGTL